MSEEKNAASPSLSNAEQERSLECGTSLSEQAHLGQVAPQMASDASPAESGSGKDGADANIGGTAAPGTIQSATTVEELRDQIAMDAEANDHPHHRGGLHAAGPTMFWSPLEISQGRKVPLPMVYCDQTASNRPLRSMENYLQHACLPFYGNTHTNTSITGSQSTAFCAEGRQLVAEAVNAKTTGKASQDVVLFAGNGTTSAVELLLDCLGFHHMGDATSARNNTVIFIGPYEHHSNLLPWRESGAEIVMVPEKHGQVDMFAMENLLKKYQSTDVVKIGTFTAASNVTGTVVDTNAITAMLHHYGALAIWDYATGAPYLNMNMNPMDDKRYASNPAIVAKDAIFFSPHKMIGGINTPGVLVIKKRLVQQVNAPRRSGGGTVFYVTQDHHRFLSNRIERYEGGTPNVVGIWRVGLTMLFKRQVQNKYAQLAQSQNEAAGDTTNGSAIPATALDYEFQTYNKVASAMQNIPNLILLGSDTDTNDSVKRLPIFSFLVKCGPRFLHYNYVCALLNDVFGIQSRGGCQCAGPYSQRLLGLTETDASGNEFPSQLNDQIETALVHAKERSELLRPGFTRLSLPFKGVSSLQVDYVIKAIEWVARNGWSLLPSYRCNHRTGEWRHKQRQGAPLGKRERLWLSHYSFAPSTSISGRSSVAASRVETGQQQVVLSWDVVLQQTMKNADALLQLARTDLVGIQQALKMTNEAGGGMGDSDSALEQLRWYIYPKEVATFVSQGMEQVPGTYERGNLLGALRPTAWYPKRAVPTKISGAPRHVSQKQTVAPTPSTPMQPTPNAVSNGHSNGVEYESSAALLDMPDVVTFKDGEHHSGEAPREEIEAGYDDGELSDDCVIYIPSMDEWIPIREYLGIDPEVASTTDIPSGKPDGVNNIKSSASVEKGRVSATPVPAPVAIPAPSPVPAKLVLPVDEKNQKKKPSRDSTTWGQGTFVSIKAPEMTGSVSLSVPSTQTSDVENGTVGSHAEQEQSPLHTQLQMQPAAGKTKKKKKKGVLHVIPPPKMMRLVTQAIVQWDMLEDGDRLLLGLSGGKDSLSLLHILMECKRKSPIKFDIEVCTVDPMTPSFDPSPLISYVESLGLKYHYVRDDIVERANSAGENGQIVSSLCAFCARMKRGVLYSTARKNNCNKLVLAQHLDDLAESFMMSVMHNGFLRTMKAHYQINAGDLSVIRPLVYCRESLTTEFAKSANLPIINENCPACFEEPKERARIKKLLQREESMYPNFYDNIKRSLLPLMHDDTTAILRSYAEEALAKSRKVKCEKRRPKQQSSKVKRKEKVNGQQQVVGDGEVKASPSTAATTTTTVPAATTNGEITHGSHDENDTSAPSKSKVLAEASEEELVRELARRRADKFRLSGASRANKRMMAAQAEATGIEDPTGMVCSLNGGNGTIPCRELME